MPEPMTQSPLLPVYLTPDAVFVRAEGRTLFDAEDNAYLDFTSGIGVTALGHGNPVVREAIGRVLDTGLIHASNLFRTGPVEELARELTRHSGLDLAYFCNSGAESVEGALKFARKWARSRGGADKHRIVALRGAFHGRLFGSLAITDRPEYREPFEPLMPGVDFVPATVPEDIERALDPDRTAAMIVEPIQGEGGVRPLPLDLLQQLRRWTEERGIALILDEIQCGFGRTGTLFAHEPAGIRPDILVLAKPLANGLPIGAVLLRHEVGAAMSPGDHGTTFGGGPLVTSVALAVLRVVSDPEFLAEVDRKGRKLEGLLSQLRSGREGAVREIRGRGLFRGVELKEEAADVVARARESGLLVVPAGKHVLRLLPALTVTDEELERAVSILGEALDD